MQPAQLSLPLLPDHAPKTPPIAMIPLPESGIDGGDHRVGRSDREGIDAQRDRDRPRRDGPGRDGGQRR